MVARREAQQARQIKPDKAAAAAKRHAQAEAGKAVLDLNDKTAELLRKALRQMGKHCSARGVDQLLCMCPRLCIL